MLLRLARGAMPYKGTAMDWVLEGQVRWRHRRSDPRTSRKKLVSGFWQVYRYTGGLNALPQKILGTKTIWK